MEDGGRWQGVTLARVAGIEETWSGKFRAYHINIYIYIIYWLFLETCSILTPTAADWSQPRQQLHDSGARIAGSANPPRDHRWVRSRQLAVAPCARQGYCMASKTKAQAIDTAVWSDDLWKVFCPSQLAAASWVSPCHLAFFGCFECQLPEFPQRLSGQPLWRRSFPSNQGFLFDKVDIFINYIHSFDALVTLVVDLKLCIF